VATNTVTNENKSTLILFHLIQTPNDFPLLLLLCEQLCDTWKACLLPPSGEHVSCHQGHVRLILFRLFTSFLPLLLPRPAHSQSRIYTGRFLNLNAQGKPGI